MHPSHPPVLLGHRAPFHTYVGTVLPVIFVFRTMEGGIPLIDKKVSELGRRQGPDGGMKGGAAGAPGGLHVQIVAVESLFSWKLLCRFISAGVEGAEREDPLRKLGDGSGAPSS